MTDKFTNHRRRDWLRDTRVVIRAVLAPGPDQSTSQAQDRTNEDTAEIGSDQADLMEADTGSETVHTELATDAGVYNGHMQQPRLTADKAQADVTASLISPQCSEPMSK